LWLYEVKSKPLFVPYIVHEFFQTNLHIRCKEKKEIELNEGEGGDITQTKNMNKV